MSGEIRIAIGDDDGASIEDMDRRSDAANAETARLDHETARRRAIAAQNRVVTAQNLAEIEARTAQAEYRAAVEVGDIDNQTAAQARMTEIEVRRVRLNEQALAVERLPVLRHDDPVEAFCEGKTEPSARWLREHRDWVTNPQKNARLTSAHFDAVAEGLTPDSSEYFEHVERAIGLDRRSANDDRGGRRPTFDYNPADVNTHVRRGGQEVVLTAGEKKSATDGTLVWSHGPNRGKPLGVQEFARRKVAMLAEGRYHKLD